MTTLNLACIQTNPQAAIEENLKSLSKSLSKAVSLGAQLIVLPEMFSYMGAESGRLASADLPQEGVFHWMSEAARELKVVIVGGSHAEKNSEQKKVFNTLTVWDTRGKLVSSYRKVHLFNLKDAEGKPIYCESDVFLPGAPSDPYTLAFGEEKWSCFNSICYDVRFPEFFRSATPQIRAARHDIVFVPAAFTYETGKDHWEVLLRARAIENQCWVVACNQTGYHSDGKKRNFGHSMVIDPWGKVVASMGEESGILMAQVDKKAVTGSRTRLPALFDRVF